MTGPRLKIHSRQITTIGTTPLFQSFKLPNGKLVDLSGWQLETREDLASAWTSSSNSCTVAGPLFIPGLQRELG